MLKLQAIIFRAGFQSFKFVEFFKPTSRYSTKRFHKLDVFCSSSIPFPGLNSSAAHTKQTQPPCRAPLCLETTSGRGIGFSSPLLESQETLLQHHSLSETFSSRLPAHTWWGMTKETLSKLPEAQQDFHLQFSMDHRPSMEKAPVWWRCGSWASNARSELWKFSCSA